MTKRQKYIASCLNPYYKNFATREEVKEAKYLARGKYWHEKDDGKYCSFSPGGLREYFYYGEINCGDADLQNNVYNFTNKIKRLIAKRSAELWSVGLCKCARFLSIDLI